MSDSKHVTYQCSTWVYIEYCWEVFLLLLYDVLINSKRHEFMNESMHVHVRMKLTSHVTRKVWKSKETVGCEFEAWTDLGGELLSKLVVSNRETAAHFLCRC